MKLDICLKTLVFLLICGALIAQSDYRITQEFKSRQRSFEIAIEYAKTADELNKIKKEINEFRNEFKGNKELLNRALYPVNFESSFDNLAKKIEFTNKKLTEISGLQIKVTELEEDYENISSELKKLTSEVSTLRNTNTRLMAELRAFKSGYGGSKTEIDSLRNIVGKLKQGINKRDTLIKDIMDNIFMTAEHRLESLNDAEKQNLRTKIQGTSLIDNIRNLINDNIAFLDASLFTADDLFALDQELASFQRRWSEFGPKLFDIYSQDRENKNKLVQVDSLIVDWKQSMDHSIWKSLNEVFSGNGIELNTFNNDSSFVESIYSYVNEEIINLNESLSVQSEKKYVLFSDRTWYETVKPEWIPLLISTGNISESQILLIEQKLDEWNDNLKGSISYFIYGIIILLAIVIIISFIMIRKRNKKEAPQSAHLDAIVDKKKNPQEDGIDENDKFIDDEKKD